MPLQPRRPFVGGFHEKQRIQLTLGPPADHVVVIYTARIAGLPAGIYSVRRGPIAIQLHHEPPRWAMGTRGGVYDAVAAAIDDTRAAERREIRHQMHNARILYAAPSPVLGGTSPNRSRSRAMVWRKLL